MFFQNIGAKLRVGAEMAWRFARNLFEYAIEIVGSVVTHFVGYLLHGLVAVGKQLYCASDALIVEIGVEADIGFQKQAAEIALGEAELARHAFHGEIFLQMTVDEVEHRAQTLVVGQHKGFEWESVARAHSAEKSEKARGIVIHIFIAALAYDVAGGRYEF